MAKTTTKKATSKKLDENKKAVTEVCEGTSCCGGGHGRGKGKGECDGHGHGRSHEGCGCGCNDCTCDSKASFPLIGEPAPEFHANTTNGPIHFPNDYAGKWVILFSHPADFTPVCTTEFMTFQHRIKEFKALNCELVGLSIDSLHSHLAWLDSITRIEFKGMKDLHVEFPVIDDISMSVAHKYGMIHSQSSTSAVRAVFVVDPQGIVRTILYYPSSTGRNFDELLRILSSLQTVDKEACATPADWRPGDDVIVPPASDTKTMIKRQGKVEGMTCLDWYLCFKKVK